MGCAKSELKVPYFDLTKQYEELREEIATALDRTCRRAAFILGEEVERFEQAFAEFCGVEHCVALNSGTSALHLALLAAGIGRGDEVITTANTFVATVEAISYTGANPVFADIDPTTANIDPGQIEKTITKRTRAIVPVHLYGRPVDLDQIAELATDRGLILIEDACQAHGARHRGRRVGGFGQSAAFSFYPGKNLGAYGEGGALTTNDDEVAKSARALRSHGETTRYMHKYLGYNYRMDGFQAAVLNIKLRHLEEWTAKRQSAAALYRQLLERSCVSLPQDSADSECVYHLFVACVEERDEVRNELARRGVQTAVHYPKPVHLQEAFAHLGYKEGDLPQTEAACSKVLSLPLFPEITEEQVNYAALCLADIAEAHQTGRTDQVAGRAQL